MWKASTRSEAIVKQMATMVWKYFSKISNTYNDIWYNIVLFCCHWLLYWYLLCYIYSNCCQLMDISVMNGKGVISSVIYKSSHVECTLVDYDCLMSIISVTTRSITIIWKCWSVGIYHLFSVYHIFDNQGKWSRR